MPGPTNPNSLATVKYNIGLGYGDTALVGQAIIRCLEYELSLRDAEIASLTARLEALEVGRPQ